MQLFAKAVSILVYPTKLAFTGLIRQPWEKPGRLMNHQPLAYLTQGTYFLHAISSPISALLITLDLSLHHLDIDQPASSKEFLTQAQLNAKHIHRLVIAAQHPTLRKRRYFAVRPAVTEVITRLNQPWKHHELHYHLAIDAKLQLPGQAFYFQEVLSCLIKNAFEAYGQKKLKTVVLTCYQHRSNLHIQITDLGQGISAMSVKFFSQPGYSSKENHLGLGLHFVSEIIERFYKGKISFHTLPRSGTIISITIPLPASRLVTNEQ